MGRVNDRHRPRAAYDRESGVRAKKELGQHFLCDMGVAERIASCVSPGGRVLEIGCGTGVLTQFLLARDDIETWGAEIDPESLAYLPTRFPSFGSRLLGGDFLAMDLRPVLGDTFKIVGNFPYNISSQILFRVLDMRDSVPEVVGMFQREVAVRVAEGPGSRDYGILSVLLQAWYDIEYLFTVDESVFNPPPKVKSAVIRLTRNGVTDLGCDWEMFRRVVKAAFSQRRKKLRNPLRDAFGQLQDDGQPFLDMRAEQLSVSDFVSLTQWTASHSQGLRAVNSRSKQSSDTGPIL